MLEKLENIKRVDDCFNLIKINNDHLLFGDNFDGDVDAGNGNFPCLYCPKNTIKAYINSSINFKLFILNSKVFLSLQFKVISIKQLTFLIFF